jgi:hypothetical protein
MILFASSSSLPTRFCNVLIVTAWPSIVHAKGPIQTSLGTSGPSPNIMQARRMVSRRLLNGVSLALSRMQASHSLASPQGIAGWSGYHIGRTSCMRIVHLQQYSRMVMGLVTCRTCSKARLVDEGSDFKLFMIRNLIIGQLVCSPCGTTARVDGRQMCSNTVWMWRRSSSSLFVSYRPWT